MIEIGIILIVTICDALRDRWLNNSATLNHAMFLDWTKKQWHWHLIKWIAFYTPLLYIIYQVKLEPMWLTVLSVFCFVLWKLIYKAGS